MQRCSKGATSLSSRFWAAATEQYSPYRSGYLSRSLHSDLDDRKGVFTHYETLGVDRKATTHEIKHAFRQKAKQHHPDRLQANGASVEGPVEAAAAFARVLTAYQVLASDRQRELYNLQLDRRVGRLMGGEPGQRRGDEGETGEQSMEFAWGLQDYAGTGEGHEPSSGGALDHVRSELRGELRSALQLAYLGPQLDTGAGQLPEAFEMDERSHAAASDQVLQLVSGRQLLGAVRVRQDAQLPLYSPGMRPLPRYSDRALPGAQEGNQPGGRVAWGGVQGDGGDGTTADVPGEAVEGADSENECVVDPGRALRSGLQDGRHGAPGDSTRGVLSATRSGHSKGKSAPAAPRDWAQGPALELLVGDEVKAVAMQRPRRNGAPLTEVYSAGGDLVAREAGGYIQLVGRGGGTQHSVVRGTTPLVRHLQFMFQPMGKARPVCVARLKRAWLPPAATWLFPPRTETHAVGGWYIEWCGYGAVENPAYLDPSIMILLAAFDTLTNEGDGKALREASSGSQEGSSPAPVGAPAYKSTIAWLKSMLAFHGKKL